MQDFLLDQLDVGASAEEGQLPLEVCGELPVPPGWLALGDP